jgi:hypothetical protein
MERELDDESRQEGQHVRNLWSSRAGRDDEPWYLPARAANASASSGSGIAERMVLWKLASWLHAAANIWRPRRRSP